MPAGNVLPYGANNYGVRTRELDYSVPDAPTAMTFHALSIVSGQGNIVGRIQSWNPQVYGRDGRLVYELSGVTYGRPVDYVPGKSNAYTIDCSRVEVWSQETELAFGFSEVWTDLIDQNRPFSVHEYLFKGTVPYRHWVYRGCWFTTKNNNSFEAENDPTIMVSGQLTFVSRQRLQ